MKEVIHPLFSTYSNLQIKQESIIKSQSHQYSVRTDGKLIGMIEETVDTSRDWKNQLLNLINLHSVGSKLLCITNPKAKVVAYINKKRGFNKNIDVLDAEGNKVSTLQQELKFKSQRLLAVSPDGDDFLIAKGKNGSLDFLVKENEESELVVSRIKKRSIPNPTLKESLLLGEQYSINSNKQITEMQQLIIIVMTIVISEQLHNA
ncbi:hypothetical protein CEH05_07485 [Halobacillus halophilus]|uniref:Uncharacterized protein n=1 Tax=Halobacillus halophilus (strain ATCC 35676 / DSM 2266 / JCM 20832 / KCTC 3685 / LMG 17431 / NBRC 102448 / NCIMB 2269) TaxID=866895 RepID=I0JL19_HALH3|nr:hypothetical protein [Halobacillus halophilus]ASF38960.1 hypothetical protein CEH05_07485 [Halobacillus halophilus]CCG44839.1 hypothetical protein HBHAL_2495 [Halobacillus halophilus DSM 2266]